jgi:hypothetical protein
MVRFLTRPQVKVTLGATEYENEKCINFRVQRLECGFDAATLQLNDYLSSLYPSVVTTGTAVQIDVKDGSEGAYPTNPMFKGVVRFPALPLNQSGETLLLKCDGAGYGFGDTVCGQEYGAESRNPGNDTLSEILTGANHGVITKWVNKIMESATESGFSYTTSIDANLTDTINYIYFPYKTNNKVVDDLCDLLTAIRTAASDRGPHWIVTTDDVFRMKEIYSDDANWHKYYNAAAAGDDAKLYQGLDFLEYQLEPIGPEANYILYYGQWRRPSNGDFWTENQSALWGIGGNQTKGDDAVTYQVGDYSLYTTTTVNPVGPISLYYPSGQDAAWDLSSFTEFNTPYLNFYCYKEAGFVNTIGVRLATNAANYYYTELSMPNDESWYHFSLPVGPYFRSQEVTLEHLWTANGAPDWGDMDYLEFYAVDAQVNTKLIVDGVHFGDAAVCRVAYNSTKIASDKLKTKLITDDIGKDDSLKAADDSGLIAQMAYAELLRCQTSGLVGWVKTLMIKDLLPGQIFKIYAKKTSGGTYNINGTEMRVLKIIQEGSEAGFTSTIYLTDDLSNSHPRPLYEDWNKVVSAAVRPEFQDRQASSMKAGTVDVRVARLAVDYG